VLHLDNHPVDETTCCILRTRPNQDRAILVQARIASTLKKYMSNKHDTHLRLSCTYASPSFPDAYTDIQNV
jgi:hypothetical protein